MLRAQIIRRGFSSGLGQQHHIVAPKHLFIGGGVVRDRLGSVVKETMKRKRPLIVTDDFLAKNTNLVSIVAEALAGAGIESSIFTETAAEPTTKSIDRLVEELSTGAYDCVIACGGGSVMDAAKAASVLAELASKDLKEYKAPYDMAFEVTQFPVVALPTTSGTGSEVTKFVVATHSDTGEKMLCLGSAYVPIAALVDYELTLSVPDRFAAETGVDALCHALEALVSRKANWYSDTCATSALKDIGTSLKKACTGDTSARETMSRAATMAGLAFGNASVTLIHGMSRPLGAHFHISHGLSNALLAPDVTEFSLQGNQAAYARATSLLFPKETQCNDPTNLPKYLANLNADLGLPTLRQVLSHVKTQDFLDLIPRMATEAIASGSPSRNPRLPTEDDISQLYHRIFLRAEGNPTLDSWRHWTP